MHTKWHSKPCVLPLFRVQDLPVFSKMLPLDSYLFAYLRITSCGFAFHIKHLGCGHMFCFSEHSWSTLKYQYQGCWLQWSLGMSSSRWKLERSPGHSCHSFLSRSSLLRLLSSQEGLNSANSIQAGHHGLETRLNLKEDNCSFKEWVVNVEDKGSRSRMRMG